MGWDKSSKCELKTQQFQRRVKNIGIKQVPTAPQSPWQDPYSERLNGNIRREYVDSVIVFGKGRLKRIIETYFQYYSEYRTRLSLDMDSPAGRQRL